MTRARQTRTGHRGRATRALAVAFAVGSFMGMVANPTPAPAGLGDGTVHDRLDEKARAFRTWMPAALRGDAVAQYNVGQAFLSGQTEIEDYIEAARWLHRAAEQGLPGAQSDLALLYQKGLGVNPSYVESYAWLDVAAERLGHGRRHDQVVEMRDMMAAFMTEDEIVQAKRRAAALRATSR